MIVANTHDFPEQHPEVDPDGMPFTIYHRLPFIMPDLRRIMNRKPRAENEGDWAYDPWLLFPLLPPAEA